MSGTPGGQGKATWDRKSTQYFIESCLEQFNKGERCGTTFTKKGWQGVMARFNELTGKSYDKPQLKNKWDSLKKEWAAWYKLFGKETGLGWDNVRHTVAAPDEWWDKKIAENPQYAKFRTKGLPFVNELTTLFKDVVATGQYAWMQLPVTHPDDKDDDDVYRPMLDSVPIDINEGTGDSDEELHATPPIEMETTPSTQKSGDKRKMVSDRKGKGKKPAAAKIADAMSILAETCRSRTETVNKIVATDSTPSITEVIGDLLDIEAISSDEDFYNRCCNLMFHKSAREMYMAMRAREDRLLGWLRFAAYAPPDIPKE